jgi:hypothetical protein
VALDLSDALEHVPARLETRLLENVIECTVGVRECQPELLILLAVVEGLHLVGVRLAVRLDHLADRLVRECLDEAEQRQARGHALEVPGEVAQVGLVEVVHVEDEHPGIVDVGAVVLGVQVAVDPDSARALVGIAVFGAGDVGVEEAGASPVEREGVLGHLSELAPERARIGVDQVLEGVHEDFDDVLLPPPALSHVISLARSGRIAAPSRPPSSRARSSGSRACRA